MSLIEGRLCVSAGAGESSVAETSGNHALLFHYEVVDILAHDLQLMASFKWF